MKWNFYNIDVLKVRPNDFKLSTTRKYLFSAGQKPTKKELKTDTNVDLASD